MTNTKKLFVLFCERMNDDFGFQCIASVVETIGDYFWSDFTDDYKKG